MSNVQCFFLSLSLFLLVSKRMTRTKMSRNLAVYINLERSGLRYIAFIENVYSRARGAGGGEVLYKVAYTGRLRSNGVSFYDSRDFIS